MPGVRNLLPGSDINHRLLRGGLNVSTVHPPLTVPEYINCNLFDSERFKGIPQKRLIRTKAPCGAIPL